MSRIILVGEERAELSGIEEILRRYGHRIVRLSHDEPVMDVMREGADADAIITDLDAAGADGLSLVSALRRTAPSVPIVLLAGNATLEEYLAARSLGVQAYLVKPVNARNLERVVTAIMRGRGSAGDRRSVRGSADIFLTRGSRG